MIIYLHNSTFRDINSSWVKIFYPEEILSECVDIVKEGRHNLLWFIKKFAQHAIARQELVTAGANPSGVFY